MVGDLTTCFFSLYMAPKNPNIRKNAKLFFSLSTLCNDCDGGFDLKSSSTSKTRQKQVTDSI